MAEPVLSAETSWADAPRGQLAVPTEAVPGCHLTWLSLVAELVIAMVLAELLTALDSGFPYRLISGVGAGMLVSTVLRRLGRGPRKPNKGLRQVGLAATGLNVGASLTLGSLRQDSPQLPLYVLLAVWAIAIGILLAFAFQRVCEVDLVSALLSMTPGGMAVMTGLAMDLRRRVAVVASVQTIRLTTVVILMAVDVNGMGASGQGLSTLSAGSSAAAWGSVTAVTLVIWPASRLAHRLHVPLAPFIVAMLCGFLYYVCLRDIGWLASSAARIPAAVPAVGQILLGICVGEAVVADARLRSRTSVIGACGALATTLAGLGTATVLHRTTHLAWLTCLLMTAPGGAPEITAIAVSVSAVAPATLSVQAVALAQLTRQLLINLPLPLWTWLFLKLERRQTVAHTAAEPVAVRPTAEAGDPHFDESAIADRDLAGAL